MRLKPAIREDEALEWLKGQAVAVWGLEITAEVEQVLRPMATWMTRVSNAEVPDDVEPLL